MGKIINSFPGYEFVEPTNSEDHKPHNYYKGFDVGFGGFVFAKPGMYSNVKVFDSISHHPHSIMAMNCFGDYTKNFTEIYDARVAIKHKEFDKARKMFNGKLAPYLEDESQAKMLAQALKISINSVYGLTSANFDNPFRDPRNVNNIVALRGALYMIDLKEKIEALGLEVISIKTDSIKVVNPPSDLLDQINKWSEDYGYEFEVEHEFDKICLVNDAVFIAHCGPNDSESPNEWSATGTQFAVPYVFKTLFSKEPIEFKDLCETKAVSSSLYLDMNENLPEGEHDYHFVGKVGLFCPMKPGTGGGELLRESGPDKYVYATGAKGYRWMESEMVQTLGKEDDIDKSYYNRLVDNAVTVISEYGDFEWFVSDDPPLIDGKGMPYDDYLKMKGEE